MNSVISLVSSVGMNVVLHVHILALKDGLCLFHSPALVLSRCKMFTMDVLYRRYVYPFACSGNRSPLFKIGLVVKFI